MKVELTNAEYHATEGVSSSDFRLLEKSPVHYKNKNLFRLSGKHFDLGSLVHKMVLEPDTVSEEFIKEDFEGADLNKNTKAYKEAKAEFMLSCEGVSVIPCDVWEQAEQMTKNVMAIAGNLLQNGVAEQSFLVEDKKFGVTRKCRPDYYREDLGLVIDLKTTADGSEYGFAKSLEAFKYHRQGAWYLDTLDMDGINAKRFVFLTVETKKPYMVDVWEIDPLSLEKGRESYEDGLISLSHYNDTGIANIVKTISLPDWAFKD